MQQQTASHARVIDPILSGIAQGYLNADMVGMALFPSVPVAQRGGKIIPSGKEDFALHNLARAPALNTQTGSSSATSGAYALTQHA